MYERGGPEESPRFAGPCLNVVVASEKEWLPRPRRPLLTSKKKWSMVRQEKTGNTRKCYICDERETQRDASHPYSPTSHRRRSDTLSTYCVACIEKEGASTTHRSYFNLRCARTSLLQISVTHCHNGNVRQLGKVGWPRQFASEGALFSTCGVAELREEPEFITLLSPGGGLKDISFYFSIACYFTYWIFLGLKGQRECVREMKKARFVDFAENVVMDSGTQARCSQAQRQFTL
ncbi:hypothetical protein EDB85DRAFT_1897995 [Lactarius pseudohatsudake]|nr:hypothetical protein EDB85DRAFT_1897995 [Lactarius pseudohatsudake]